MNDVLILYNEPDLPADHPDYDSERAVVTTVAEVEGHLQAAGYVVSRLGICRDPDRLLVVADQSRPDAVFNLYEGLARDNVTEVWMAGLLDWLRLPYTGCPAETLCLARQKDVTKLLLRGAGLPTPPFAVMETPKVESLPGPWPLMVKPARQDASVGIDQQSVVTNRRRLTDRVEFLLERFGPPVLVEQFIAGREMNVAVINDPELRVLPPSEIEFRQHTPGYWPIVTYDAKWAEDSAEFLDTPPRCPALVDDTLARQLQKLARRAYRLLNCRDYARVDFRIDAEGRPFILEINPNPDYSEGAGLSRALEAGGIAHAEFSARLVEMAKARGAVSAICSREVDE